MALLFRTSTCTLQLESDSVWGGK